MPRRNVQPETEAPVSSDVAPDEVAENESGVNPPPYDAQWITIKQAAALAGVTGQSIRNAYENHEAFNTSGTAGTDEPATEHWFRTKMCDQFGNPTDHDVVYVDRAAVERWIAMRADKPSTLHDANAPKRHIMRLTPDQVAAYNAGDYAAAFDLADGTRVELEVPPQSARKSKKADQPDASTSTNGHADDALPESGAAQTDLFDVDLIEA